jgi:hypothetical protein
MKSIYLIGAVAQISATIRFDIIIAVAVHLRGLGGWLLSFHLKQL